MMKKIGLIALIICILAANIGFAAISTTTDLTNIKEITVSLVNQNPDPALAGNTFEARVGFVNLGGTGANDMVAELVEEYPFTVVPGQNKTIEMGAISAYQDGDNQRIVKFQVQVDKDASAGTYPLKINYYEKGSGVKTQQSLNIDVQGQQSAEVIYIDKSVLVPGEQTPLTFTINNVGSSPLRDLTFSWENDDQIILPVGSDNTKYIKYIDVGDGAELDYNVIADTNADPGLYPINLKLTYTDPLTGTQKEIETTAGVYVGGGTDFDIAFSESSGSDTSFTVANIGSNPAYSVSVSIPKQDGWTTTGSNAMIIGNLNKGDYTVASFTLERSRARTTGSSQGAPSSGSAGSSLDTSSGSSGSTPTNPGQSGFLAGGGSTIKIQVDYTDTKGDRMTVTKDVQMNTQTAGFSTNSTSAGASAYSGFQGRTRVQQQSFWSQYKWYVILIVVLLLGLVMRSWYKKKKLLDPEFKVKDIFKK